MDFWSIALAVVLGGGLGWLMVRNQNTDYSKIVVIPKEDFVNNMRKGQLIDIRKKELFEQDKIKGARNFKVAQMTQKYSKLRYDQAIYLYCKNGRKSKRAARKLVRKGFKAVYVLEGGFESYNQ
jgi:rhodanese-related sulfurtransferase